MAALKVDVRSAWRTWGPAVIIALIYAALTFGLTMKASVTPGSDMAAHARFVIEYWQAEGFGYLFERIPYPGWHVVVMAFLCMGASLPVAASLACALFAFLTAVVAYRVVVYITKGPLVMTVVVTVALLFVAAIYVPAYNPQIYYGQGSPTIWHNPTYNAVKPFALLSCFVLFKMMVTREADVRSCAWYSILTVVCLFLKPSFFQIQAPAVFAYLVIDAILNRDLRFVRAIALSFVPALVYMALEMWVLFYSDAGGGGGVSFGFLEMYAMHSPKISISIALLLAFPVYATVVLWKDILQKKSPYSFFVILLMVGFCEYAFLIEGGERAQHGNFGWGYYSAVFLYWAFMLPLFAERAFCTRSMRWPLVLIGCILVALHFIAGVLYYLQFVTDATGTFWF